MLGFQYRQTRDYDNFQIGHFRGEGRYEIPILQPGEMPAKGIDWISFNFVRGDKEPEKHAVHFYIDDYQFTRIWDSPSSYLEKLQRYAAVCSPDFSTYNDFPRAQQVWNKFRNHWMGAYWQYHGINVIQTVVWTDDPADDEWVFVAGQSQYHSENEFLYNSGTHFKILGVYVQNGQVHINARWDGRDKSTNAGKHITDTPF